MNDAPPARMRRLRSRGREGFSPSVRPVHHSSEARLFCRSARSLASIFSHVPSDFFPSANAARSKIVRSSGERRKQNFGWLGTSFTVGTFDEWQWTPL